MRNLIIILLAVLTFSLTACYDEKMEWNDSPYGNPIDVSEIPLTLEEQLARLGALKEYAGFPVGIGVDMDLYMTNENINNIINENFNVVTVGYHMKHGPMVGSDGALRYTAVDQFIERLPQGIDLFGHALAWHQNQNGEYLRQLIAPETFTPPDLSVDNLLDISALQDASFTGWQKLNPGAGINVVENEGMNGGKALKMVSSATSSAAYNLQLRSPMTTVENGKTYTVSFFIRSDKVGKGRISFEKGSANQYPYLDYGTGSSVESFSTGNLWKQIRFQITTNADQLQLNFDLGYLPEVSYYIDIDHIAVVPNTVNTDPIAVEMPDEQKAQKIGDALAGWITNMVTHYKNRIHSWDVVNEPVNDAATDIRHGNGKGDSGDIFHWQDFLGKDYAVTAFRLARAAGNPDDVLFINDFNLESNLNKCRKLIEYTEYIESQGQKVDGIGTQMHLTYDTLTYENTMTNITEMFNLLAVTGKKIKVSELDIRLNKAAPEPKLLTGQAEMYREVARLYREIIPAAQQYGITVWCVSDNADEHVNWLENDAPCLWDAKFKRKEAYRSFIEGLAGKTADELLNNK